MSDKKLNMAAIRLRACAKQPYLSSALWSLTMIESELGNGSMGVDPYWRVYMDPKIMDKWSIDEVTGVLIHEVWHLLRKHHERSIAMGLKVPKGSIGISHEMREKKYHWNLAGDLGINDDLRQEVTLPKSGNYPEKYDFPNNLSAEEYYALIRDMDENEQPKLQNVRIVAGGGGDDDRPMAGPMEGNDGGGAGGNKQEQEGDDGGDEGQGRGLNEGEAELVLRKVANDIKQGEFAGTAPGHAERWADAQLNPRVDWRTKLMGAIRANIAQVSGMVDYTYNRPSRRQSAFPRIVLPSLRGPKPDVGVGIDTSGSMSTHDLELALTETKGILNAVHAEVKIYAGDTQVYKSQKVYRADQIDLAGGGGTDMGAVLITMNEDNLHIGIIITDGYTPWLPEKPKNISKVIVIITRDDSDTDNVPNWVDEVINIDHDGRPDAR